MTYVFCAIFVAGVVVFGLEIVGALKKREWGENP